jgi:hypothetical protein
MAIYGAETWALRATDLKYVESLELWCWRRMEKIIWTDNVRKEGVLLRHNEQRYILYEIRKRKINSIGHLYVETAFKVSYRRKARERGYGSEKKTRNKT